MPKETVNPVSQLAGEIAENVTTLIRRAQVALNCKHGGQGLCQTCKENIAAALSALVAQFQAKKETL